MACKLGAENRGHPTLACARGERSRLKGRGWSLVRGVPTVPPCARSSPSPLRRPLPPLAPSVVSGAFGVGELVMSLVARHGTPCPLPARLSRSLPGPGGRTVQAVGAVRSQPATLLSPLSLLVPAAAVTQLENTVGNAISPAAPFPCRLLSSRTSQRKSVCLPLASFTSHPDPTPRGSGAHPRLLLRAGPLAAISRCLPLARFARRSKFGKAAIDRPASGGADEHCPLLTALSPLSTALPFIFDPLYLRLCVGAT